MFLIFPSCSYYFPRFPSQKLEKIQTLGKIYRFLIVLLGCKTFCDGKFDPGFRYLSSISCFFQHVSHMFLVFSSISLAKLKKTSGQTAMYRIWSKQLLLGSSDPNCYLQSFHFQKQNWASTESRAAAREARNGFWGPVGFARQPLEWFVTIVQICLNFTAFHCFRR